MLTQARASVIYPRALVFAVIVIAGCLCIPARAETPAEWIALGKRVHGAFGAYIPLGIRIGLDARSRLGAGPRHLSVTYETGSAAPCPCVVDGIAIALEASPGQGTLLVVPRTAPRVFGIATIVYPERHTALVYTIPASAGAAVDAFNRPGVTDRQRYDAVMRMPANRLFTVKLLRER